MSIAQLRATTGFALNPIDCGPNEDAFLGFIAFAFGKSQEEKHLCDQFVASGGIDDTQNHADIPAVAGEFIDWLIANHWGEEPSMEVEA